MGAIFFLLNLYIADIIVVYTNNNNKY